MRKTLRQIVAFGGGGFSMESGNPLLDEYVLGLPPFSNRVHYEPGSSGRRAAARAAARGDVDGGRRVSA